MKFLKLSKTNHTRWSQEEDEKLIYYVELHHQKCWSKIASYFPERTVKQCSARWQRMTNKKQVWTDQDDDMLIRAVDVLGKDWTRVSEYMNRPANEVRSRYINKLDPNINNSKWTAEEDELMLKLIQQGVKEPSVHQKYFPGRSIQSIKNRYQKKIRPELLVQKKTQAKQQILDLREYMKFLENYLSETKESMASLGITNKLKVL